MPYPPLRIEHENSSLLLVGIAMVTLATVIVLATPSVRAADVADLGGSAEIESARGIAQETGTATVSPSETPGPSPTWEVREMEGLYGTAFEYSGFVEGTDCPEHGRGWWLTSTDPRFAERLAELRSDRSGQVPPLGETTPYIVRTRFVGRLSPPGSFGHRGAYPRMVVVSELLEMERTDHCGMDLPDLALADYQVSLTGLQDSGCILGGVLEPVVELCIVNQGRLPASPSWVKLPRDNGEDIRMHLCGLAPGESHCLRPVPLPVSHVEIDVDDDVTERFEGNNWVGLTLPTFEPPPACTPLPEGTPSPTPQPTPTIRPCGTSVPATTPPPTTSPIYLPVAGK